MDVAIAPSLQGYCRGHADQLPGPQARTWREGALAHGCLFAELPESPAGTKAGLLSPR